MYQKATELTHSPWRFEPEDVRMKKKKSSNAHWELKWEEPEVGATAI